MQSINWGDLPTWVAAIGTVGTLLAALLQIDSERRRVRWLRERQQSKDVSAWITNSARCDQTAAVIQNQSQSPIYNVIATLVIGYGAGPHTGEEVAQSEFNTKTSLKNQIARSVLPPGRFEIWLPGGWGGMCRKPGVEIAFTDFQGIHWIRRFDGKLEKIKKDPIQHYLFPQPFSDFSINLSP